MESIADAATPIPGWEELYVITRNGIVYSLPRRGRKLRILKPVDNMRAGYLRVKLSGNGKNGLYYIHRLVAQTFVPNPDGKPMVNHIDGNKTNNRAENLEWVTNWENRLHAFEHGLYPNQKIHPTQRKEVFDLVQQGTSIESVATRYGLKPRGVESLVRRYKEAELRMAA